MIDVHCQQGVGVDCEHNYVRTEDKFHGSWEPTIVDEIKDGKVDKIIGHGNELYEKYIASGLALRAVCVNGMRAYRDQYDDVCYTSEVQFCSRLHTVINSRT